MSNSKESKRGKNFTDVELNLLVGLINQAKFKSVLECKKTDSFATTQKSKVWASLTAEFNATTTESRREVCQLQRAWKNLKFKAKGANAKIRRERNETGGGPCPPAPDHDPLIESVNGKLSCSNSIFINIVPV